MAAPATKSRAPLMLGLAAAGGVGYYLYTAGGDPKVANKEMQCKPLTHQNVHLHLITC